jgi:hypothetical protein
MTNCRVGFGVLAAFAVLAFVASGQSAVFFFKSLHVFIFNLLSSFAARNSSQQNVNNVAHPSSGEVENFQLTTHPFAQTIFSNRFTTDAVFKRLFLLLVIKRLVVGQK